MKVLLVEDNPAYRQAALSYFATHQPALEVIHAPDFKSAKEAIETGGLSGVITDCFFPRETGSLNIELGLEVIDKLTYGTEKYARTLDSALRAIIPRFTDPELDCILTTLAYVEGSMHKPNTLRDSPVLDNEFLQVIQQRVGALRNQGVGDDSILAELKNMLSIFFDPKGLLYDPMGQLSLAMTKALQESPENQALGVLVAELASQSSIPFIIATSTFHHDNLTQLVYSYTIGKGWPTIVDVSKGEPEKSEQVFWEKAYGALAQTIEKIQKRR